MRISLSQLVVVVVLLLLWLLLLLLLRLLLLLLPLLPLLLRTPSGGVGLVVRPGKCFKGGGGKK